MSSCLDGAEVPTPDGGLDPVEDSENFLGDLKVD